MARMAFKSFPAQVHTGSTCRPAFRGMRVMVAVVPLPGETREPFGIVGEMKAKRPPRVLDKGDRLAWSSLDIRR